MNPPKPSQRENIIDQLVELLQPADATGEYIYSDGSLRVIQLHFQELAASGVPRNLLEEILDFGAYLITDGNAPSAGQSLTRLVNRFFPSMVELMAGMGSIERSTRRAYDDVIQGPRRSGFRIDPLAAKDTYTIKAGYLAPIAV